MKNQPATFAPLVPGQIVRDIDTMRDGFIRSRLPGGTYDIHLPACGSRPPCNLLTRRGGLLIYLRGAWRPARNANASQLAPHRPI